MKKNLLVFGLILAVVMLVGAPRIDYKSISKRNFNGSPGTAPLPILPPGSSEPGGVKVRILPPSLNNLGGWRLANSGSSMAWRHSNTQLSGLSAGYYKVQFRPVAGWTQPKDLTVRIQKNKLTEVTVTYKKN